MPPSRRRGNAVRNPNTGRMIRVGGPTHKRLVARRRQSGTTDKLAVIYERMFHGDSDAYYLVMEALEVSGVDIRDAIDTLYTAATLE